MSGPARANPGLQRGLGGCIPQVKQFSPAIQRASVVKNDSPDDRSARRLPPHFPMIRILFVGDVVGNPAAARVPGSAREDHRPAAHRLHDRQHRERGGRIRPHARDLRRPEEVADRRVLFGEPHLGPPRVPAVLDELDDVLRPANNPPGNPGHDDRQEDGLWLPVAVVSLQGQVFMTNIDSPFRRRRDPAGHPQGGERDLRRFPRRSDIGEERPRLVLMARSPRSSARHPRPHRRRTIRPGHGVPDGRGMSGAYEGVIGFNKDRRGEVPRADAPILRARQVGTSGLIGHRRRRREEWKGRVDRAVAGAR